MGVLGFLGVRARWILFLLLVPILRGADAIWKIVFDLSKVVAGSPDVLLVHVSFTSGTPVEQQAVQNMASQGVSQRQANVLVNKVYPAAKAIVGNKNPTAAQKKKVHDAMSQVVNLDAS